MHTGLCVRENVPAKTLAAVSGQCHVWMFEDPVVRVEYCVSILFISLLYKHQQGEGTYWDRAKGHRALKYSLGTPSYYTVVEVVCRMNWVKLRKKYFVIYLAAMILS